MKKDESTVNNDGNDSDDVVDKYEKARIENEQLEVRKLRRELTCAKNGDPTVGRVGD